MAKLIDTIINGYLNVSGATTLNSLNATSITQNGTAISLNGHKHAAGDITSGTLGLNRGGTGATTAAGAITKLGLTGTVVEIHKWTRSEANMNTNFTGQKLSFNFNGFPRFLIVWKPSTTAGEVYYSYGEVGKDLLLNFIANGNAAKVAELRTRNINSDVTGLTFSDGYGKSITSSSTSVRNDFMIPISVYGVKVL